MIATMKMNLERASRFMFTRIVRSLARTVRDEDLSVAQLAALHLVDQAGDLRQSALGEELMMSPSAASRMIDQLVERDLLERRESPDDRRVRTLHLTARGETLLDQIGAARVALFERITKRIPKQIVELFMANIERVRSEGEV
jgi:MarR family transcriptional regulator for hemolysin